MELNNVLIAFGLTLFAGLSTGIGSALAFFTKHTNKKILSIALGFSAGVMIYVSFVEIFPEAQNYLVEAQGLTYGGWLAVGAFFLGIAIIAIIDKSIPSYENPHELHTVEEFKKHRHKRECKKLMRMGVFIAFALAIHNFPEGFATFATALVDIKLGIAIAVAIAIHNIPEGIAVSFPIYCATGKKRKAFAYSFLSGLAEPLGALLGYFILLPFLSNTVLGIVLAAVAGIMVFISLDELLPAAREFGEPHLAIYGLISGMAIMAVSLLLCV
ncbi:zinc transporter ZupT [Patescibacteria group bacterium]